MNNKTSQQISFDIQSSSKLDPLPANYIPIIIEVFDQEGILLTSINIEEVHQTQRPAGYKANYLAWYFDEELVFFQMGKQILVNRLELMAFNFLGLATESTNK